MFDIKNAVTFTVGRGGLLLKKYAPEICMALGTVGFVGAIATAPKSAEKAKVVMKVYHEDMATIDEAANLAENGKLEYSQKDKTEDLIGTYRDVIIGTAKAWAPTVALAGASLTAFYVAFGVLKSRNARLATAAAAAEAALKLYRTRVVDDVGADKDLEYMFGAKKVQGEVAKDEATHVIEAPPEVKEDSTFKDYSEYARFFDSASPFWTKRPEENLMFLKNMEEKWNDKLYSRGHVFLNEVYDSLGIPHSQRGAVMGWVRDGANTRINFGIFNNADTHETVRRFINGYEPVILLDFNVDPVPIYNRI